MLSYGDLEGIRRAEFGSPTLQKLQPDFYVEARRLALDPRVGEFKEKILEEVGKIYRKRMNKIVMSIGNDAIRVSGPPGKPIENLMPQELDFYNRIIIAVEENRTAVLESKVEPIPPQEEAKAQVKVRIRKAMPAIAGSDGKEYGPFREDDVVELPTDSAELLLSRNIAEKA
jgi:DNA replication initiation complex subunit (GINS family)